MAATSEASATVNPQCRVLIQQCMNAALRVDETNWVEIGRGIVVFVSFFAAATEEMVRKAAQSVLKLKLSETEDGKAPRRINIKLAGKFVSVCDLPGSVLLIPQACLGGKRKNNSMQYHQLIAKDRGQQLFDIMASELEANLNASPKVKAANGEATYSLNISLKSPQLLDPHLAS